MFQINKTLISEELISKQFTCNLSACRGACCVEGEAGAPLEEDEIKIKLGYHIHDNISGILDKNSLMNFKNTHGFEFLEDYFYTPHYFEDLNMDNPFNNIEKTEIWNWGSVNVEKCQ